MPPVAEEVAVPSQVPLQVRSVFAVPGFSTRGSVIVIVPVFTQVLASVTVTE